MTSSNAATREVVEFAEALLVKFQPAEPAAFLSNFESGSYGIYLPIQGFPQGSNFALRMTRGGGTVVRMYIWFPREPARLRRAYAVLERQREDIELRFGEKLHFRAWTKGATIEKRRSGDIALDRRTWPDLHKEMMNWYSRLRGAVDPVLPEAIEAGSQ